MPNLFAGTSGWSYTKWKPGFYPPTVPSKQFLSYYATRLNSVEVNYTFRTLPTEALLATWIAATPQDFRFAIKAHQSITHFKRLRDCGETLDRFAQSILPLRKAGRLGPVLFQLPPNFKADVARLSEFFESVPKWMQSAIEFRHESWFANEIYAVLRKSNVALCLAEDEDLETPEVATTDFNYLRLRKESYPPKARKEVAKRIAKLAGANETFAYFKHEDSPNNALYAEALLNPKK
jgi:uncharacterized protein YecE (DUF72 family)